MADSKQAPKDAAARLQRLEDERAVIDRIYAYAHSIDYGPGERLRDCFTEDCSMQGRTRGVPGQRHSGNLFRTWKQVPNVKHLVHAPRVTSIEGDVASVESYWTYVTEDSGGNPHLRAFGRYVDQLKRCPDGKWRVSQRATETESVSAEGKT